MATVLECTTEEQRSVLRSARDIFLVYGGKCLSSKAVHIWVEKFSKGRSEVAHDGRPGRPVAEVAETTVEKASMLRVSTHW
jgi:hypothetical protein